MSVSFAADWRRRQLVLRGILLITLTLLTIVISTRSNSLYSQSMVLYWLAALCIPSLWYLPTRHVTPNRQQQLLMLELILDSLLFMGLMYSLGGSANPLTFYLLVPTVIGALTLSLVTSTLLTGLNITGYGVVLYWHQVPNEHSSLHAVTHELHTLHSQGMWLAFSLVALLLTLLGQTLQRARKQEVQQQATALSLALQRERMYQLAGGMADRAHELNTPLSTLLLTLDEARELADKNSRIQTLIIQSQQLGKRLAQILRSETQHDQMPSESLLSTLIAELDTALRLLAPTLTIRFIGTNNTALNPTLAPTRDWQRIFLNLGYNAIDAGATELIIESRPLRETTVIQVSDNGPLHEPGQRQGLGVGIALIETTLASMQGTINYRFAHSWSQAIIEIPRPATAAPARQPGAT